MISKWDKEIIVKVFMICENQNKESTIIMVTNIYKISINNPDI